jgi:hypothetical protein
MASPTQQLINWNAPPPDDSGLYVPILSPKARGSVTATIVSEHMIGVNTHFSRNRTEPCIGIDNGCEACKKGQSTRWKGYLGAWHGGFGRYVLAEITAAAARDVGGLLTDPNKSLRGMEIHLCRVGVKPNAPVKCEIRPGRMKSDQVPSAFDERAALCRIWERRKEDAPLVGDDVEEIPT